MKLAECQQGHHGACEGCERIERFDEQSAVLYTDEVLCECWCHVHPIPDPDPTEATYAPE